MTEHKDKNLFVNNNDLKDYIHGLHNFMRNNGLGYGMKALEVFSFFYGLKLTEKKLFDSDVLDEQTKEIIKYSNLVNLAIKRKNEIKIGKENGKDIIPITRKINEIYNTISNMKNINLKKFMLYDIPSNSPSIREVVWIELILKMDELPVGYEKGRVNLSGKVYEYFIGRNKETIKELGSYYTDRFVTDAIYKKLDIQLDENNNVKTMIDAFAGSGGFTLEYSSNLIEKYGKKINWKKNVNNIHHFDMAEYVVNMAGLEMFAITGELPESNEYNFSVGNSFTKEFLNRDGKIDTYDYVISNPPYGGSSASKGAEQIKCDILISHLKKNMDELKTNIKKHIINAKKLTELINSITRLNFVIKDKKDKQLYVQNTNKFNKIKEEYEDNDVLIELINKYKKNNEQICYLNYKLKKHKEEQESMQVNYSTCSDRIKKFVNNTSICVEEPNEYDSLEKQIKYKLKKCKMSKLSINDKEACSLILLMDLVNENGTCCAVLKEGVFFDNSYSELRNALINNYNVTDIISVPQDAFENTSTKTSIVIFKNNGKTKTVQFSELKVNKCNETLCDKEDADGKIWDMDFKKEFYENEEIYNNIQELELDLNGWNYVSDIKDEIQNVEIVSICKASYKDIAKPTIVKNKKGETVRRFDWSLNWKNYNTYKHFIFTNDQELDIPEDYQMLKLADILKFMTKSKHKASVGSETGKYRFYTSSDTVKFSDICDVDDNKIKYLIFGTGGNGSLFIDNQFSCSTDNFVIYTDNNTETEYIYYYIKKYWDEFIKFNFNGSTMGHIKKENLLNTKIPIPKDITTLKKELTKLQKLHQSISTNTELIPQKEKAICELIKKLTDEGKEGVDYESKKLGDVCEIKSGKRLPSGHTYSDCKTKYPYIQVSNFNNNSVEGNLKYVNMDTYKYLDKYIINHCDIYVSIAGTIGKIGKIPKILDGSILTENAIRLINFNINQNYLIYYLLTIYDHLKNKSNNSTIDKLSIESIKNTFIKILKPSILIKYKLQELFDEVDTLKDTLEADKIAYQTGLKDLFKDFEQDEETHDNTSSKSAKSEISQSSTKSKIVKINGIRCIQENSNYYEFTNDKKGKLIATINKEGEVELMDDEEETDSKYNLVTINEIDYIKLNDKIYTIDKEGEPDKIYGTYINGKFKYIKNSNDKIIVKGRNKEKSVEDLEAELEA
jgi:type I restriction enzyme S subunit